MTIVNNLLIKAKSQIGITENPSGSNKVKYNTAYYGKEVSGPEYPWCCAFIWWLFNECKASPLYYGGKKTASCTTLMNYYKKHGQFSKTPQVGCLVFYNWGKGTTAKHIGIVTEVGSGYIKAIEGNTAVGNDSNGGKVMERTRYANQILGYAHPYTNIPTTTKETGGGTVNITLHTLKSGSKGENVEALQILLNGRGYSCGTADGEFGSKTLTAVKKFQKAEKLTQDGIVGENTWGALLGE